MKKLLIVVLLTSLAAAILSVLPTKSDLALYDSTIRLHVLANSDAEADQSLKLLVRDAILDSVSGIVEDCTSKETAEAALRSSLPALTETAQSVLVSAGSDDEVHLELSREHYPTRGYDGVRLPAGTYTSLRVMIGSAEGHNWWCVLFPPLCTSSAQPQDELAAVGFTGSQIRILTDSKNPRYVLKFRILELLGEIFG